jgi:hypothetical protein
MRFKSLIGVQEKSENTTQQPIKLTKFKKLIKSYGLYEQTADDPNAAALQDAALDPSAAQTQAAQAAPVPAPEEEPVQTLTSEGEVELIRLLRTALTLDVPANTMPLEIVDAEINKENAREIYEKIKTFMSTFTGE